ncbi:hypothetical protein [Bacillus phage SPO1L4]|nr:hypothetical protein [Bacillus phage SPO1L3]WIT26542.1 hypothetical protein [Bacillus phage SPO1L4]WIT26741.1 hypothetical protein [Bacillus phage SPO1L5]
MELFGHGNHIQFTTTDHGFCRITVNKSKPLWINKHKLIDAYIHIGNLMKEVRRAVTYQEVHDLLSQHFLVQED